MAGGAPRLALVTGTTSGIGRAVAEALLARRWTVVGLARRDSPFERDGYRHVRLDLADLRGVAAGIERDLVPLLGDRAWARIGLVNNAATPGPLRPLDAIEPADLVRVYALNTAAPAGLMGAVLRHAPPATPVRIVNVSSGAAVRGFGGLAAYGASKAALRMIGMVAAAELDEPPSGMPSRDAAILDYQPGVVETPMQVHARAQSVEDFPWVGIFKEFEARGYAVTPDRPAHEIVTFLESDGQPRFSEKRLQQ
jgi:benzil reductase ((S)-benzoin forming)